MTEAHIEPLRRAGLSDEGIHDLAGVTAYFNFVNRIAQGLGVELEKSESSLAKGPGAKTN